MKYFSLFSCLLMLVITIINPQICIEGTHIAIKTISQTILPSLFPAIIISNILVSQNLTECLANIFHPIFKHIFSTTKAGTYAIIIGFLCGYPTGANNAKALYYSKQISKEEYLYILKFVNNPSPSFIFAFAYPFVFMNRIIFWKYIILIYFPFIITALLFRNQKKINSKYYIQKTKGTLHDISHNSIDCLATICFFVFVFSVLGQLVPLLPISHPIITYILSFLEITSGLSKVILSLDTITILPILISITTGGICVSMQTFALLNNKEEIKNYLLGKLTSVIILILLYLLIC